MTVDGIRQCFRCVAINIKATEQYFPVYPSSIVSFDLAGLFRQTEGYSTRRVSAVVFCCAHEKVTRF